VFGTVAAESQRLINETYSAFVQGFMPTLARPDVDSLEGLTTAIILDQERMGANVRSTVGTVTDANAMLRVVFSRIAKPNIGGPQAYSFNIPSVTGGGAIRIDRGAGVTESRTFSVAGGHVPALRGHGYRLHGRPAQLYDETKSLRPGGDPRPRLHRRRLVDPAVQRVRLLRPRQADPRLHRDRAPRLPLQGARQGPDQRINLTYEGLVPRIQKSMLSKDVDSLQPHSALRGARGDVHHVSRMWRHRLNAAARSSTIAGISIADACAMQISDLAEWVRGWTKRRCGRCWRRWARASTRSSRWAWATSASTGRRGRCRGRGPADADDPPPRLRPDRRDYVFDEPTIGLHAHDVERMNALLRRLRDKGNTVLVVEHDPEVIRIADHVVDMGPGAGPHGGSVVFEGTVDGLVSSDTTTGRHLDLRGS
jgi:excinuclease UvrABC ATPase subunit